MLTDPAVRRFLGGPVEPAQVSQLAQATVGEVWGRFCIVEQATHNTVGSCAVDSERGELEVSFQLLPEHWGRGVAFEAVSAVLDWVWQSTEETAVIAVTQAGNKPSLRLLHRLTFNDERTFAEFGETQVQLPLKRPSL